ncbi:MAG: hypothetical protein FWG51_00715 [Firmicutes bacterium]|nr:hypothetical protein [Bacillota bacterium]
MAAAKTVGKFITEKTGPDSSPNNIVPLRFLPFKDLTTKELSTNWDSGRISAVNVTGIEIL